MVEAEHAYHANRKVQKHSAKLFNFFAQYKEAASVWSTSYVSGVQKVDLSHGQPNVSNHWTKLGKCITITAVITYCVMMIKLMLHLHIQQM